MASGKSILFEQQALAADAACREGGAQVHESKMRRPNGALALVRASLALFAGRFDVNPSARLVLTLPFAEQRLYLAFLAEANQAWNRDLSQERAAGKAESIPSESEALYGSAGPLAFVQRYNQLPCTTRTRRARADLFEANGLKAARILLLGDDDLVSVELSRRGFSDVTVADCDASLLEEIERRTRGAACPPKLERADFRGGYVAPRRADVICLDPPHHEDAIRLFADVAIANLDRAAGHGLFLMYNPFLTGKAGHARIIRHMESQGFALADQKSAFNAYPMTRAQKISFSLAARIVLGPPGRLPPRAELNYFSDCFRYLPAHL